MAEEISEKEYLRGLYKTALDQKATGEKQSKLLDRLDATLRILTERHDHQIQQHDQQIELLGRCVSNLKALVFWFITLPIVLFLIALVVLLLVGSMVR